jgi:hypothetical protein
VFRAKTASFRTHVVGRLVELTGLVFNFSLQLPNNPQFLPLSAVTKTVFSFRIFFQLVYAKETELAP